MSADSSKIRFILLADDDDDDTMLFVEATENLSPKIKVSLASDGQKLLNLLAASSNPDIIFLDLNMPKKGGLECLKSIRSDAQYDKIPVVMYSTSQSKKDIDASYDLGANYYVVKPFDFEDIKLVLKKLFEQLANAETVIPIKEIFVINTRSDKRSKL
jgi:CheY-like chemotaxis protein